MRRAPHPGANVLLAGQLVHLDAGDHFGPFGVVPEHVVNHLVVVHETQVAVRALMRKFFHDFIVDRPTWTRTGSFGPFTPAFCVGASPDGSRMRRSPMVNASAGPLRRPRR